MERDELMQLIGTLRSDDDSTERESLITQISDAVNAAYDNADRLANANSEYVRTNEQLRKANMELFVQIGERRAEPTAEPQKETKTKLTFDELFKGELN